MGEGNNSHTYFNTTKQADITRTIVLPLEISMVILAHQHVCTLALHPVNASHGVALIWLRSYTYRLVGGVQNISDCLLLGLVERALVHMFQALLEGGRGREREGTRRKAYNLEESGYVKGAQSPSVHYAITMHICTKI